LALPGHQAVAENQLVDVGRRDAGALYRRLDRHRTEIARGKRSEVALETADRRSRGTDDDYRIVLHNEFAPRQKRRAARPQPYAGGAALSAGFCTRRGRRTSSPPQFGHTPFSALAHVAQNVHS
jgi:hypothetical protein